MIGAMSKLDFPLLKARNITFLCPASFADCYYESELIMDAKGFHSLYLLLGNYFNRTTSRVAYRRNKVFSLLKYTHKLTFSNSLLQ